LRRSICSARGRLHEKVPGKVFGRARHRQFKTFFGIVSCWRNGRSGHFPLDKVLGIAKGGFSQSVCLLACNLATRMSFAASASVFGRFAGWSPNPGSIENMVLGIGSLRAGLHGTERSRQRCQRPRCEQAPSTRHRDRRQGASHGHRERTGKGLRRPSRPRTATSAAAAAAAAAAASGTGPKQCVKPAKTKRPSK